MLKILKFGAAWCGPCKSLNPIILEISKETGIDITHYDADEHGDICSQYKVKAVPTLIFLKDDIEVD